MARRKKKTKEVKLSRGKPIDPVLLRARNLRSSLLRRVLPELKNTTPTIQELYKWLSLSYYICYYSLEVLTLEQLTIDHKLPLNRGGDNSIDNLCFCSSNMNNLKGNLNEIEFRSLLELCKTWEDGGKRLFSRIKNGYFR